MSNLKQINKQTKLINILNLSITCKNIKTGNASFLNKKHVENIELHFSFDVFNV